MKNGVTSSEVLTENERLLLQVARETYGETNQILVSVEELCELSSVCTKYPRYEDKNRARRELHDKVVDEVSDVLIVLDHITAVFDIDNREISKRIAGKIARLRAWMAKSNSMEQTTVDREVETSPCIGCKNFKQFKELQIGGKCYVCAQGGFKNWEAKEQ